MKIEPRPPISGRNSVRSEIPPWKQEVVGSNPAALALIFGTFMPPDRVAAAARAEEAAVRRAQRVRLGLEPDPLTPDERRLIDLLKREASRSSRSSS